MVSLEWLMHNVGGYSVAAGEIGPGRWPSLHSGHCDCRPGVPARGDALTQIS
jgi:hypothetical protein